MRACLQGAGRKALAAAGGRLRRRRIGEAAAWLGLASPGLACQGSGGGSSDTMSLQYGAEETPLAGSYGAADSFPKDFGYGVEEEEEEAAASGGGVGAGAGGGCGPGGADSSKPRILLMGLRRSGKSSIQKVSGAAPGVPGHPRGLGWPPGAGGPRGGRRPRLAGRAVPRVFSSSAGSCARGGPARGPWPRSPRPSQLRPGGSPKAKLAGGRQVRMVPPGTFAS